MKEEKETPGQTSTSFHCDTHCPCATVASHLYKYMGVTKKKKNVFFPEIQVCYKIAATLPIAKSIFFLLLVAHPGRAGKMIRTLSLKYLSTTSFKNLNIIATKIHY